MSEDPRLDIIGKRYSNIRNIIAVSGAKGGIGKSVTSATLALLLKDMGYNTGLFDLDFSSPSLHVVLGCPGIFPEEDKGIIPPKFEGIEFMTITHLSGDNPFPIRGAGISNAILEFMAVTLWSRLDYLIIDMPPGISDVMLDTVRFFSKVRFLVLTTASRVSLATVTKLLDIFNSMNIPELGIIENMSSNNLYLKEGQLGDHENKLIGKINLDSKLEESLGNTRGILKSSFAGDLKQIVTGNKDIFRL